MQFKPFAGYPAWIVLILLALSACKTKPAKMEIVDDVEAWARSASIYEVNIRQYTPEGTIKALRAHLPRLQELGVKILWLMPVQPIGEKNRKGTLGSYYSIRDYTSVNPEYGSLEDMQGFVKEAHELGMKVILDWVANHSSFDNVWVEPHPDWYTRNDSGEIIHPAGTDWTDVADLNYDNREMRAAMIDAMQYWIKTCDIDGFRCDVAGFVPIDFWVDARQALDSLKPVFMLAEWEEPNMMQAFHMTYGWDFHHVLNEIAKGKMSAKDVDAYLQRDAAKFADTTYRMYFVDNHDENSWKGSLYERMGAAADAMTVLAYTLSGMPLVYSGQEASLDKRLRFFEKDTIDWTGASKVEFLSKLIGLKTNNPALWNGRWGGKPQRLDKGRPEETYCYIRKKDGHEVIVMLNLSGEKQAVALEPGLIEGSEFTELFSGKQTGKEEILALQEIPAWGFFIFSR